MKHAPSRQDTKRSRLIWMLSIVVVASMVCSLVVAVFPEPATPAEAAQPTSPALWTPSPVPATPTAEPTATATALPTPTATPLPREESGLPWSFAVLGASEGLDGTARAALAAIQAEGGMFVLHTGDMTTTGTQAEFVAWQELCTAMDLPLYPVPGERDNADGLLVAYSASSGAPRAHYSFDRGALHIAVVNASLGAIADAELAWLGEDLAATAKPLRVVALHYPPLDSASGSEVLSSGGEGLIALVTGHGVNMVIAGHGPVDGDEVQDGVRYVTVGALSTPPDAEQPATPHYLRVKVDGEELALESVPVVVPAP